MAKGNRSRIIWRYIFVVGVTLLFVGRIVYKLWDTTVVSADEWNNLALKELSKVDTIAPQRGNILACDGSVLATNVREYTVRIDFRSERFLTDTFVARLDTISKCMAREFGRRTAKEWKEYLSGPLKIAHKDRPRAFVLIDRVSYADYLKIRTLPFFNYPNRNYCGITHDSRLARVRPYGAMARRSIGGVGATRECSEVHGISGLEKALDSLLYGIPGLAKKVSLTKEIVPWTDVPAVPGANIITTIDIKMQDIVENELNKMLEYCDADWGVAVLMEVATGNIKAISNLEKNTKTGIGYIEAMNRAVQGYEPGSVVKPISMMLALEEGAVSNLDEVISTGSSYAYAGGRPITDAHGVGSMRVSEVIERSSNIGMTKIIARKFDSDPGRFYSRLKEIGFLEPMHTGIAGECIPRIDSLPDNRGGRIALSRQCYGYATKIPPLYTLSIYNAIANGGRYVRPRLVMGTRTADSDTLFPVTYIRDRICSETNAAKMRTMLRSVVWGDHGTGRRLRSEKVAIAGKTGTAYVIEQGGYNTSKKRLAFCGFFPADNPRFSCMVLVRHPRQNAFGAASTSGEVLKGIAENLYSRGMLDNSSDYLADAKGGSAPTMHASCDGSRASTVSDRLGLSGKMTVLAHPGAQKVKGVPDVHGYGLRDALSVLEKSGYNVKFRGAGYVAGQHPRPGTEMRRGSIVMLELRE